MADKKISELTSYTPAVDVDLVPIVDTTTATAKHITWANIKATLKTYFDSLTTTLTNKTLTSPVINTPTGIVKGDVGLGNVDNTSDTTKNSATATLTNKTLTSPKLNEDVVLTATATQLNAQVLASNDGWISANETWTYASATTITVPSGAATKHAKGDKIKLTQTTVKYFYIISVADTVLTVTGGTDYTVANAAITNNYYSHQENVVGFPSCFAYTASQTGFSTSQTLVSTFSINGGICTVAFNRGANDGTSNANNLIFGLPVNCVTKTGYISYGACSAVDNGSVLTTPSGWRIDSGNNGVVFYKQFFDAVWTTSNPKSILGAIVTYFI